MLLGQIQSDLKNSLLAKDEVKVSTLRLLLAEIKNKEIAQGADLSDEEIISVIQREAKKRKEASVGFRSGGREDSAIKEEAELKVLESYLPNQLSEEALTKVIEEVINETGATGMADMGKAIGAVMGRVKGRADGGIVSSLVKERLSR